MAFTYDFEPSGAIKLPSNEELAGLDGNNAIVMFMQGMMQDGRPYFAYVAVKPGLYREFCHKKAAKQPVILSEYGEVLAAGFSFEPPASVVSKMKQKYGCDPKFQHRLISDAIKQQQLFLSQNQTQRIDEIVGILKRRPPPPP